MMTKIVNLARKNILLRIIICSGCWIGLNILSIIWETGKWLRQKGIASKERKKIKQFKNIHEGQRCFVICTGPSITVEDLNLLKNEITFSMNSILLLYDKTEYRPTYYGVNDVGVYKKLQASIRQYSPETKAVFLSERCAKYGNMLENWYNIPANVAYHTYDRWFRGKFWCRFSDDAYAGTYNMYSVTHFLIQIAVYMGFKEIYLVGADCNQRVGKQIHFVEYGVPDTTLDTARERNICGYEEIKRYCDQHDVTVYNATRGGELEVFDRVSLDKILSN